MIASYNRRTSGLDTSRFDGASVAFVGDSLPAQLKNEIMNDHRSKPVTTALIRAGLDRIAASGYNPLAEVLERSRPPEVIYHSIRTPVINSVEISGDGKEWITPQLFDSTVGRLRGKSYNADSVQGALERILSTFRKKGYSLALIESVQLDPVRGALSFIVHEGRIKEINYEGNERTKDYIIRRELPLSEGDVFDAEQASRGLVNVKSTELFEYVLLEVRYVDDAPILVVKVKEKSAELLRLGLHADNEHSLVVTVDIHDANFRGAWEDIGLLARYGYRDRMVQVNYTVNRIFHSYLTHFNMKSAARDIFAYTYDPLLGPEQWDRIEEGNYRENKYGWSFAFGSHFERLGDVIAEVRLENQNIIALSGTGYTPERYHLAALKIQSTIDTEDKFWYPTSGVKLVLSRSDESLSTTSDMENSAGFGRATFPAVRATHSGRGFPSGSPMRRFRGRSSIRWGDSSRCMDSTKTTAGAVSSLW
jgi:outer membrane protein assembly factor BamA